MAKIVLADDDLHILKLLETVLVQHGYEVRIANNGKLALDLIKKEKPDLVIIDIMMPEMDGFHLALELKLKQELEVPDTKYIILSARGEKRDLELGKKLGARYYILKPFEIDDLLKKIKEALSE